MVDDDKLPEASGQRSADGTADSVTTKPAEPTDDVVATRHRLVVGGTTLDYTATAGRVVLREEVYEDGVFTGSGPRPRCR